MRGPKTTTTLADTDAGISLAINHRNGIGFELVAVANRSLPAHRHLQLPIVWLDPGVRYYWATSSKSQGSAHRLDRDIIEGLQFSGAGPRTELDA